MAVLALGLAGALQAQVTARLLALESSIQPGKPVEVVLELNHRRGWHTYWEFAGTGYPTTLQWTLPEGWSAGEFRWPVPGLIHDRLGAITGQGFEGRTLLPILLTPPANLQPGSTVVLKGKAEWLMCEEQCVPGQQDVELRLSVTSEAPQTVPELREALQKQAFPRPADSLDLKAVRSGQVIRLSWKTEAGSREVHFLTRDGLVSYDRPQTAVVEGDRTTLELAVAPEFDGDASSLRGVLRWVSAQGTVGHTVEAPLTTSAPATQASGGLIGTLALAVLGGLILNLMPCVFPVLGIKILGFVNQAGEDRRKVTFHGLAFTGGVLASFWALAGALALLRAGGDQLGWGFQLQSPAFVFVLTAVMLVFGLSMSGVFEFGLSATGIGSELQMRSGLTGTFFSGVLATVVATPCSAPFLAPVLGTALALPVVESLAVFTAIGLGLSTPYLLLSIFPAAVRALPRPGAWMETFKQAMAFPLYATAAYLVWVLAGQVGEKALRDLLFGLVMIALAAWLYGRLTAPGAKPARARLGVVGGVLLLLAGLAFGWPRPEEKWEAWSPTAVAEAQKAKKWIYVDFTARWCATCQTNKAIVFSSNEVKRRFSELGVVKLKADWTNRDPAITRELAKYGRSAVPVTLVYAPGSTEPRLLPEILSASTVLEALDAPK